MSNFKKNHQILMELVKLSAQKNNKNMAHISSLVSARQYLLLYQLFDKYIPKGSLVLDWGTGIGHFSYFLCQKGYQAVGYSMEDFSFKNWVKGYQYHFVQGNPKEPVLLPFKDKFFEGVVSVGVLEHVGEFGGQINSSVEEIHRVLKPGGLFISYHLPNKYSLIEFLGKRLKKFHHQKRFTKKDIQDIAAQAGFKLIKVQRYGLLPRNSFAKLPEKLKYSTKLASFWDILDQILSITLSPICQNYFFIAKKIKR